MCLVHNVEHSVKNVTLSLLIILIIDISRGPQISQNVVAT